jgi:DNA-binding FadR family transcriptional regulator
MLPLPDAPAAATAGTLVHQAMQAVTGFIRSERLKAGDWLPGELHFARELGVSRAVMREAFGKLAALRLIDVANGRRPRVSTVDMSVMAVSLDHAVNTAQVTFREVWDVRRTLELRTAALAASLRTDEEAAAILHHARSMTACRDDFARMTQHDVALHQAIAIASRNALFAHIVASFSGLMAETVPVAWKTRSTEAEREGVLECHRRVAEAIADRDAAAAERAMDAHFDDSIRALMGAGYD